MDLSANLIAEMRFKLTTSLFVLFVAAMLVAVAACGSSEDSRTRNAALGTCRGSLVEVASQEYIATLAAEQNKLKEAYELSESYVNGASSTYFLIRGAVPPDLTLAVAQFDVFDRAVTEAENHIKRYLEDAEGSENLQDRYLMSRESLPMLKSRLKEARAEMNRLLAIRAEELTNVTQELNRTIRNRDEAYAKYLSAVEAYNKVATLATAPECPVILTAGDAENYVREVASTIPPTTVQRKVFQFIDEPAPTTVPEQSGEVDEASNGGNGSNGGSSPSETTIPVATTPDELSTDSTSTTAAPSDGAGNDVTVDTLPIPVASPSVEYVAPTAEEIIENISELFYALDKDSPVSEQNTVVVAEILDQLDDLSKKISSGEISITEDQVKIVSDQLTSLLFIVTVLKAKKKNTDDDSSLSVSKRSVSVSASGFSPGTDVIFANRSGRPLRNLKASDGGVAVFDVDVDATADRDLFMLGGRNSAGEVVAVPVLVEFDENTDAGTSTTIADENSSTATSVVDVDDTESSGDGSGTSWILWLLLVAILLAIAYGIRKQLTKRGNDAN